MEWMKKEGFQGFVDVFFGRPMFLSRFMKFLQAKATPNCYQ